MLNQSIINVFKMKKKSFFFVEKKKRYLNKDKIVHITQSRITQKVNKEKIISFTAFNKIYIFFKHMNIRLIKNKAYKSFGHICPKKKEVWGVELDPNKYQINKNEST